MRASGVLSLIILVSACGGTTRSTAPVRTGGSSTRAEQPAATPKQAGAAAKQPARGPRHLNGVPPGHYPKSGECRLWYSGRPPGQQPKAQSCSSLRGSVPAGAFVLYGGKAWDADYDWATQARRERGSVPDAILDVLRTRR